MKYEKTIIIGLSVFLCIAVLFAVKDSIKSYQSRKLCDRLRTELDSSIESNRQLADTIGQCQSILTDIRTTTTTNITTARQAIELIEQLRMEIQELESYLYGDSASYDYNYWDSYLGLD